jgi:uncharacterized protein
MSNETTSIGSRVRDVLRLRWRPSKDLLAVAASWILVVGALYTATFVIGDTVLGGMGCFLTYAILDALVLGFGIPVTWTFFVRKRSVAELGLTRKNLVLSIIIQVAAAGIQLAMVWKTFTLPSSLTLLPLVTLALTIGFFEAVFWRGWVQSRLEDAFGAIPGIILGSALYALYHVGYGMPWSEMLFLFGIGLMFAVLFRITKSVFILWPLFQPFGQLMTLVKDGLNLPWAASLGFIDVLAAMIVVAVIFARMGRKKGYEP